MQKLISHLLWGVFIFFLGGGIAFSEDGAGVSGVVRDAQGGVVVGADVSLLNAQQGILGATRTDAQGRFAFEAIPRGSYMLVVASRGFAERRLFVRVRPPDIGHLDVTMELPAVHAQVTVTATPGRVEETHGVAQSVNVIEAPDIALRAKAVVAQAVNEEVGVHLQRTSPGIAGIFVRGLTGNKVNVFVDGVRHSTSAMRGGINTFLSLVEPSSLTAVEILRGPNSAQYGSDAVGGSVQFLSLMPSYSAGGPPVRVTSSSMFDTADMGFGSNLTTSYGARNFGLVANVAGRRVSRLRPGGGLDSHSSFTRFFGLPSEVFVGDRLPDTTFTQYGGMIKLNWSPAPGSQLIAHYSRSQQDGGRRYDQLLGGDGNLVADLRNLMLDLFYVRYDKLRLAWFDNFTAVYSFSSQREERVNQGGRGNPRASISREYERTRAHGFQAFADKQWGSRDTLLVGGEYYHERLRSPSFGLDPVTQAITLRRPRVPDRARNRSGGAYIQNTLEAIPNRLRLVGNLRYSAASYRARAADSPVVNGAPLWPDDSLRVSDVTARGGVIVTPVAGLTLSANLSRGFRAPHMTDLGTLGLTGSGFEVAAPDVAGLSATIGSTADRNAVSTGRPVQQVAPETSLSYELGARYRHQRFQTDFAVFLNDLNDNITKQALILPRGAVGLTLGGQPIIAQSPNGVVFVGASSNPVLVRANFGDARIRGFEHTLAVQVTPSWSVRMVFTHLRAWDKATGLPPNIEGGTPAPDGYLKIRYAPGGGQFWIEPYLHAAARQDRLSSLDLEDRRTGATRSRQDIQNFFRNGATARGLVGAGPDGLVGTADDVLLLTGETLAQVQDRVLGAGPDSIGAGVDAAPLFRAIPGYVTFNVRGGLRFGERHEVTIDFQNLGDRNYRGISWGLDAPGRSASLRYVARF